MAVDTLGWLLALHVTPANEPERAQGGLLAQPVQAITGQSVESALVDPGDTAEPAIHLEVVNLAEAKHGLGRLPRRWVVERSFAWMARCRRLARDYERVPDTLAGLHDVAFAILMLTRCVHLLGHTA